MPLARPKGADNEGDAVDDVAVGSDRGEDVGESRPVRTQDRTDCRRNRPLPPVREVDVVQPRRPIGHGNRNEGVTAVRRELEGLRRAR